MWGAGHLLMRVREEHGEVENRCSRDRWVQGGGSRLSRGLKA